MMALLGAIGRFLLRFGWWLRRVCLGIRLFVRGTGLLGWWCVVELQELCKALVIALEELERAEGLFLRSATTLHGWGPRRKKDIDL